MARVSINILGISKVKWTWYLQCLPACLLSYFSRVWLFATLWTIAHQSPLSMGFSRQEYWSGLPHPAPGDFPNPGIEPLSPALLAGSLPSEPWGKPRISPILEPKIGYRNMISLACPPHSVLSTMLGCTYYWRFSYLQDHKYQLTEHETLIYLFSWLLSPLATYIWNSIISLHKSWPCVFQCFSSLTGHKGELNMNMHANLISSLCNQLKVVF